MSNFEKIVTAILIVFFFTITTLFILYSQTKNPSTNLIPTENIQDSNNENYLEATSSTLIEELNTNIDNLIASSSMLLERIETLEEKPSVTTAKSGSIAPTFQKQIVYIGSASTNNRDWTDSGVEIKLSSSDYPSNVDAVFEVGLSIIGGEAWARLINKTTGAIMAITEISHSTSTTTWKTSPSFKLHSGTNTYALEIRSSSDETANFSGARIVIGK